MKVLFATDGSEHAQNAARFFSSIRFAEPYELVIATVSFNPTTVTGSGSWADQWMDAERKQVERAQAAVAETLRDAAETIDKRHLLGAATLELKRIADEEDVDLIVMGAVGHSALRRIMLGSVSDYLATHASCSVLIVRPHESDSGEPLSRALLAYDASGPSKRMIEEFESLHFIDNIEVNLVTVSEQALYMGDPNLAIAIEDQSQEAFKANRRANHKMVDRLRERFPDVLPLVKRGYSAGETINKLASENATQLIFVADAGHTFWDDFVLGSCTKDVLRYAPCSIWISREHRRSPKKEAKAEPSSSQEVAC